MKGSSDDAPPLDADGEVEEDNRFGRFGGVPLEFSERERVNELFPVVAASPRFAFIAAPNSENVIDPPYHASIMELWGECGQYLFHFVIAIIYCGPNARSRSTHRCTQYL